MKKINIFWLLSLLTILIFTSCSEKGNNPVSSQNKDSNPPPAKPSIIRIEAHADEPIRSMFLQIRDLSDNEDGFLLEKRERLGDYSFLVNLSRQIGKNNDFFYDDDNNIDISTVYSYRIRAYNGDGNSAWAEYTQTSRGTEIGSFILKPSK